MTVTGDFSGHSLLAVFAHPDDESIACGGLLARCAELGARVSLICVTHGESGNGAPAGELGRIRAGELESAARILGIAEVVLLDYQDGFLPWVDDTELEQRLAAEMRRIAPDVVITFGADGLYWHPDHIAVHERTTAAVASLGRTAPALYYVTMPPGIMRALADTYPPDGRTPGATGTILGVSDPDAFGAAAQPPTLIIDTGTGAAAKLAALKCHRTQIASGVIGRIPDGEVPRLLSVEYFHRAPVGAAGEAFIERLAR